MGVDSFLLNTDAEQEVQQENDSHMWELHAQIRLTSASQVLLCIKARKPQTAEFHSECSTYFLAVPFKQHDRPSGASNYLSAPAATGVFVLLVCKTLKGEVGPKEEKNLLSLPVLQQTEANNDAHCLYELCPGLVPPNSFKESRFLNH